MSVVITAPTPSGCFDRAFRAALAARGDPNTQVAAAAQLGKSKQVYHAFVSGGWPATRTLDAYLDKAAALGVRIALARQIDGTWSATMDPK
jgi:DNA-binding phage protein